MDGGQLVAFLRAANKLSLEIAKLRLAELPIRVE